MDIDDQPPETVPLEPSLPDTKPQPQPPYNKPEPITITVTNPSSYVTYTDLTPFPPDPPHFTVPISSSSSSTFSPSILSELHDDFGGFPPPSSSADPDLDSSALLNHTDVAFPQPLQDQMGAAVICGGGGGGKEQIDMHQWTREARQKEIDEARQQRLANQRRDRLWTNLTDQKFREL